MLGIKSSEQWLKHLQWIEANGFSAFSKVQISVLCCKVVSLQLRTLKHHSSQFIWVCPLLRKEHLCLISERNPASWGCPCRMTLSDAGQHCGLQVSSKRHFKSTQDSTFQWPIPLVSCLHPITRRQCLFLKEMFYFIFPSSSCALRANFNSYFFFVISHLSN